MGNAGGERVRVSPRAVVAWGGLAVLVVGAFLAALGGLNQSLYGASSFVERYLEAIADDDIGTAAATPGVALDAGELEALGLPDDISTAMLRSGVVEAGPEDVSIVSDVANPDGTHSVTASYRLGTEIAESAFEVRPIDPLYGLLNRWEFADSPLAVIDVTAAHNPLFTVGTLTLDARANKPPEELANFTQVTPYLAVAPAVYQFHYESTLLAAAPVVAPIDAGEQAGVEVDAQPTAAFVERVQTKVDEYLAACAAQHVLQPADCPFGIEIDDRVTSEPEWTIVTTPQVTLTAGENSFDMPPTEGVAHISVEVQDLFDGHYYTLEEDRSFNLALAATIRPDGSIAIQLK
ncbi:hypothetical protein MUN74_09290 [Agromyces endophyticus]|uniref:hypothetical protein n=1 Tax=Agromyces sp. H17E-10 TaxID=2932244 RepID=UPI001FD4AC8E|nr:hypothetical protein [Agromyces sp. H17E-10]UOQ91063.1 hypothetical protein MUN74_09290 [Agromyces sp. H17E-10]